jgi:lysophospholipase L1-like esterase
MRASLCPIRPRASLICWRLSVAAVTFGCAATHADLSVLQAQESARWRFDFGPGQVAEGYVPIAADLRYDPQRGYGFEAPSDVEGVDRGGDPLAGDYCTGAKPFSFSIRAPDGNYRATVTLGGADGGSTTTIHAEVRRLLAHRLVVSPAKSAEFSAVVNVRTPALPGGRNVRLKDRERTDEAANWDDRLTLTFSGDRPCVAAVTIVRDDHCPTLFLMGDSTVCDQAIPPWNSWGQMLPRFFGSTIAVANHAESGESIRSALGERRFEKLYSLLRPGDWVAVQFGHNDMKSPAVDALETYARDLTDIIDAVRQRGATPILITSMERKNGVERDTLGGYPDAVRRVAAERDAPLVDLHRMSKVLYKSLRKNLDAAFQDGTHHTDFGSYELARCVVEGLRTAAPGLAEHLSADAGEFDPAMPDSPNHGGVPTATARSAPLPTEASSDRLNGLPDSSP